MLLSLWKFKDWLPYILDQLCLFVYLSAYIYIILFSVYWCVSLSVNIYYSLGQDNWNEVQHDFFGHVIPLVLASHDSYSIVNDTI